MSASRLTARTVVPLGLVAACLLAAQPAIANDASPADAPETRLEPKVTPLSSYEFSGRIKIYNKDVTFDVPADYRESFSFWTDKMKGTLKEEKLEYITVTRDRAVDGSVKFRRQIPRYDLEILKSGKLPAVLPKKIQRAVTSKVWEGTFDRYGNVTAIEEIAGEENETVHELSFPFLDHLFPSVDGPKDLRIGEGITIRTRSDLPTRLTVSGLEDIGLVLVRTYTLKEIYPGQAIFDVASRFESDPDRPPSRERITCAISGEGSGKATFNRDLGAFTKSNLTSTLVFDIDAPLRKLPTHAEGFDPGLGSTQIDVILEMSGQRRINRLLDEEPPPAQAAD